MIRRIFLITLAAATIANAGTVDPQQEQFFTGKYGQQDNSPVPGEMLVNTDPEPDLTEGFESLFNGKDLDGWTPKGGYSEFEAKDGILVGTCVPGSDSTYLCTDKSDYTDFIFTCDTKWLVEGNTGVMFRSQTKQEMKEDENDPGKKIEVTKVFGPQGEMEGPGRDRCWSGGIYGQSCGGWFYPLWLTEHKKARESLDDRGWNRLTIMA